jgi:hypothetical protein
VRLVHDAQCTSHSGDAHLYVISVDGEDDSDSKDADGCGLPPCPCGDDSSSEGWVDIDGSYHAHRPARDAAFSRFKRGLTAFSFTRNEATSATSTHSDHCEQDGAAGRSEHETPVDYRDCVHIPRMSSSLVILIHLFSGYWREGDVQSFIHAEQYNGPVHLVMLSIDIVIDSDRCNLASSIAIHFCLLQIWEGAVTGSIAGPPCVTWSSVRWILNGGPPPLLSFDQPRGLPGLSLKHLRQVVVGSFLYRATIRLFLALLKTGGAALVEHPALATWEPRSASAWALPKLGNSLPSPQSHGLTLISLSMCRLAKAHLIARAPAAQP